MSDERLQIPYPVIVEGRYDKLRLESVIRAQILTTDGFGVFNKQEKTKLFRALASKSPLIVLTDSDGAGTVIRNFFKSILPKEKLIQLYTPAVKGKERRKTAPSKAGNLGVEGIDAVILRDLLAPYVSLRGSEGEFEQVAPVPERGGITKADLYMVGLSGKPDSAVKRHDFAVSIGFPGDVSPTALLTALNLLYTKEEFFELVGGEINS